MSVATDHPYRAEVINAFATAVLEAFQTMVGVTPKLSGMSVKAGVERGSTWRSSVCGIIGLSGASQGSVSLVIGTDLAIQLVSKFAGESYAEVNSEVIDGVGELTNIVAGGAKRRLSSEGLGYDIGLPKIVVGEIGMHDPSTAPCLLLAFACELGAFTVEVVLVKKS